MRPSRLVLGEILGPGEVSALLNAISQGNDGSMCTLHAGSAIEVFERLISLALQPPDPLPADAAGMVVAGALQLIVVVSAERGPDRGVTRRYVSSVREIGGWDGRQVLSSEVCAPGPDGLAVPSGAFVTSAADRLGSVGYTHRIVSVR